MMAAGGGLREKTHPLRQCDGGGGFSPDPTTHARAHIRVAIDGPSGAGKSTVAKRVAAAIGADYIDTGAMYRAVALKIIEQGIDPVAEPGRLADMLAETAVDQSSGRTLLDGRDVTGGIRTPEVTAMASKSSAMGIIREKLVELQRGMGASKSVVMDGRDIGTNVFPDAEHKFFMTASARERARRRFAELSATGARDSYEDVLAAIEKRDYDDSHRELNPLTRAEDAVLIDTDGIGIEEVTEKLLSYIAVAP
ncbi:MAG: (d)CMP kinase [Clostridiales Family XIII bacterium]|jgi:cytidylate kinase|nr:(d)CMP kinase [Clostridiales Family XIII bacterium]